jgi:hypothetical protein
MDVVELKVTLEDVEPKVKRTLWVPLDIRLDHLHLALQATLGWDNDHLYMFQVGQATWGEADPDWGGDDLPADKTSLIELRDDTGVRVFKYLYDFGDGWEHKIRIGKVASAAPGQFYPQITSIEGRCPPEDIGGPPGYAYFLEVMADKHHPEYDEMMEIHGESFDPNDLEADHISERIKCFAEWLNKSKAKKSKLKIVKS